jgi:hypothetical protein
MVVFWLLAALAGAAGFLGIWLTIIILPALFRYQLFLLEAQARGLKPQPPGVEFFSLTHGVWMLFPVVIAVAIGWATISSYSAGGTAAMLAILAVAGLIYPAILGVLAITHSPLQSVNPVALHRFISECGISYSIAPIYLLLIAFLMPMTRDFAPSVRALVEMFFVFSFHSVIGAVIEPRGMADNVYIPDADEPGEKDILDDVEKSRVSALAHAYGFISRDNREGGFRHIFSEIEKDPDPGAAWRWYFDKMLGWEQQQHALFFAQHCIHDMLAHGERVPALKVIMRCRLIDENFKPAPEDVPAAVEAAESGGNIELAAVLKQG